MRVRSAVIGSWLLSLGCGSSPAPNVVFISIDSLRADHVGTYGYERDTTPNLDRLAAEGTLYENVVADSSWTLPTHVAMMTGLGSLRHGVDTFSGGRISPQHVTLAERLRGAGYSTIGVYSGPYLNPVFGFGRGFDRYEGVTTSTWLEEGSFELESPDAARRITRANARSHESVTSPAVTEEAIRALDELSDGPFFLFLHYFDVHYDYIPPESDWRTFDPDYDGSLDVGKFRRNDAIHPGMPAEELEHVIARYDGEILFTDRHIGTLLDALNERGLTENTIVVVTSDHGEEFFEHGQKGHGRTLFDEVIMVPLIVRMPGTVEAGARIGEQLRHTDIMPMILELVGLLAPSTESRERAAVSTLRRNGHWLALRKPPWKYIAHRASSSSTEVVYDLSSDPGELAPVSEDETSSPRRSLRRELKALEARAKALRDVSSSDVEKLPESVLEELRSLGYVQ